MNSSDPSSLPSAPVPPLTAQDARLMLSLLSAVLHSIKQAKPIEKTYVILSRDLVRLIRSELGVELNFLSLFHSTSESRLSHVEEQACKKFERFDELKHFVWFNSFEANSQLVVDPLSLYYSLDQVLRQSLNSSYAKESRPNITHRLNYSVSPVTTESMMSVDPIIPDGLSDSVSERVEGSQFLMCGAVGTALSKECEVFPLNPEGNRNEASNFWDEAWKSSLN